jgi:hypothetical protein
MRGRTFEGRQQVPIRKERGRLVRAFFPVNKTLPTRGTVTTRSLSETEGRSND